MKSNVYTALLAIGLSLTACQNAANPKEENSEKTTPAKASANPNDSLILPGETHFKNLRMLTYGGNNAEAYFSFNNQMAVFQSDAAQWGLECDQIFYFDLEKDNLIAQKPAMISTGKGRTTCSYFMPGDTTIIYASTHLQQDSCPPVPDRSQGYVWPIYPEYDIFVANLQGQIIDTLTHLQGYDAEPTVSPQGDKIVFTSTRSGDLELWTMNLDGSNKQQVTHELGYDGGAFFSPDGKKLVFRASRPESEEEQREYRQLLEQGLVKPTRMEIYTCNIDGSDLRQITDLGKANWAPFFHPSGEKILFASNHEYERGYPFNLYLINTDGSGLEQVTHDGTFDAFPMFSFDGKKLLFSSNRFNGGDRSTNVFIADWVD